VCEQATSKQFHRPKAFLQPHTLNLSGLKRGQAPPFPSPAGKPGLGTKCEAELRIKVLPLERILASKMAANRAKDRLVIPVLQSTLRTLEVKEAGRAKLSQTRAEEA
jgi:hypothetical protein